MTTSDAARMADRAPLCTHHAGKGQTCAWGEGLAGVRYNTVGVGGE
jgi:hypothetical protein